MLSIDIKRILENGTKNSIKEAIIKLAEEIEEIRPEENYQGDGD